MGIIELDEIMSDGIVYIGMKSFSAGRGSPIIQNEVVYVYCPADLAAIDRPETLTELHSNDFKKINQIRCFLYDIKTILPTDLSILN